ncbi:hypothetical protein [Streptomyces sp. NPDC051014]|uniref:hypothetical protein n=1 Tax=Streptomyces sp. NPDC051014 TaxID=3155751 RepID=UPI00340B36C7
MSYPIILATPGLRRFAEDVDTERQAQLTKSVEQHHPDGTGPAIEVFPGWAALDLVAAARGLCQLHADQDVVTWRDIFGEAACEALAESDPVALRKELVQVAAVCAAWIADLDSRPTTA